MAIEECPHCHTTVLMSGSTCPACRKRVDDPAGASPHLVRLKVWLEEQLPPICATCVEPTQRLEHVIVRRGDGAGKVIGKVAAGIALGALLHHVPGFAREPSVEEVTRAVHRCQRCADQRGPLTAEHVEVEDGTVELIVHRGFAEAVHAARKPRGWRP